MKKYKKFNGCFDVILELDMVIIFNFLMYILNVSEVSVKFVRVGVGG